MFGELDFNTDRIKDLRILSKEGSSIQGYCIDINPEGAIYIGGNADSDVVLTMSDGSNSENLNGNFIVKWDISQDNPTKAFAVGTDDSDNVVKSIAVSNEERVFFAGDYNGTIRVKGSSSLEFGGGDSFFGSINPETKMIDMFQTFGSYGMESATKLHLNKTTRKLYLSGYYGGQGFSLYGVKDTKTTVLNRYNYYFAVMDLSNVITHSEKIEMTEDNIKVFANRILISNNCQYIVYRLTGEIVKTGYSNGNELVELENGIYVVKAGNSVKKVIVSRN